MKRFQWKIKQLFKMSVQHALLPLIYRFWRIIYFKKKAELIIFADAHHESLPFSMMVIHERLEKMGYSLTDNFHDYTKMSSIKVFIKAAEFMQLYAKAQYVFICDNFLPVASCRKSKNTKVIQLWHSCGLLKKMGYDTTEDIPLHYIGNVYKNYDLITVSAPCCIEPLISGMRQPYGIIQATGVSRTDIYFDMEWRKQCKQNFFSQYPEAVGKKIILWAPTFRGNAANPYLPGMNDVQKMEKKLGKDYWVIYKVHPHIEKKYHLSNCEIPTEQLFPVTDLLITDYSSTVFDYIFFQQPYVLYAPDLEEYEKHRGFYVPYHSLSPYVVTQSDELASVVKLAMSINHHEWIKKCQNFHVASCDGHSSERIIKILGL